MKITKIVTSLMLSIALLASLLSPSALAVQAATSVDAYIKSADKLLKKDDPLGALREIRKGMDEYGINNQKLYNKAEEIRKHTQIVSETDYMLFMSSPQSPVDADSMLWDAIDKGTIDTKYFMELETRKYIYKNRKLVNRKVYINANKKVPKSWSDTGACSNIELESTVKAKNGIYEIGKTLNIKYDSEGRIISYTSEFPETVIATLDVYDVFGSGGFTTLYPTYHPGSKTVYTYEYDSKGREIYFKSEQYEKESVLKNGQYVTEWVRDYSRDEQVKTTYNKDGGYTEEAFGQNSSADWLNRLGRSYSYPELNSVYAKWIYDKNGNLVESVKGYNILTDGPVDLRKIDNFDKWYKSNSLVYDVHISRLYYSEKYENQKTNEYLSPATNKYSKDGNFHLTVDTKTAKVTRDKKGRIIKSEEFEDEYNEYTYDSMDRLLTYKTYSKSDKSCIAKWEFKYEADGGLSIYQYQSYDDSNKLELYSIDKYDKNGFKSQWITPEDDKKYITYYGYPYFSDDIPTYAESSYYYSKDNYKQGYLRWSKGVDLSFPEFKLVDDFGNTVYVGYENMYIGAQYPKITIIKYHYDPKYINPSFL